MAALVQLHRVQLLALWRGSHSDLKADLILFACGKYTDNETVKHVISKLLL